MLKDLNGCFTGTNGRKLELSGSVLCNLSLSVSALFLEIQCESDLENILVI